MMGQPGGYIKGLLSKVEHQVYKALAYSLPQFYHNRLSIVMSHGKQFTLYTHKGGPNGW